MWSAKSFCQTFHLMYVETDECSALRSHPVQSLVHREKAVRDHAAWKLRDPHACVVQARACGQAWPRTIQGPAARRNGTAVSFCPRHARRTSRPEYHMNLSQADPTRAGCAVQTQRPVDQRSCACPDAGSYRQALPHPRLGAGYLSAF
ncbi:hypothetical protein D3C76_1383810 [compost metagenome]